MSSNSPSAYLLVSSHKNDQQCLRTVTITADSLEAAKLAAAEHLTDSAASADLLDTTGSLVASQQDGQWFDIEPLGEDRAPQNTDSAPLENLLLARVKGTMDILEGLRSMKQAVEREVNRPKEKRKAVA